MKKLFLIAALLLTSCSDINTETPMVQPHLEALLSQGAQETGNYSVPASSCDAPDYTYAYALSKTWKTLSYDLVYCWGATEITTSTDGSFLLLEKGDGSAWIQITLMSGIPHGEKPEPEMTQNEDGTTTYVYEGYFTVTTNAPENGYVQGILYSLELETESDPLSWEGMDFYPLEGLTPQIYGDSLIYIPTGAQDLAGDAPLPIALYQEIYNSLADISKQIEVQNQEDLSFRAEWGEIVTHQNSHGTTYKTQTYRYEGDEIIGIPTGTFVSIEMEDGRKFLFTVENSFEDQIEPFTEQFQ